MRSVTLYIVMLNVIMPSVITQNVLWRRDLHYLLLQEYSIDNWALILTKTANAQSGERES
jgi:hypothetical protein